MQASFQPSLSFSYPQILKVTGSELDHALPSLLLRYQRIEKHVSNSFSGLFHSKTVQGITNREKVSQITSIKIVFQH